MVFNIIVIWKISKGAKLYKDNEDYGNDAKKKITFIPQVLGIF